MKQLAETDIVTQFSGSVAITVDLIRQCPKGAPRDVIHRMTCPKCGGTIQFGREPRKGHLRASCGTPLCFSMIE